MDPQQPNCDEMIDRHNLAKRRAITVKNPARCKLLQFSLRVLLIGFSAIAVIAAVIGNRIRLRSTIIHVHNSGAPVTLLSSLPSAPLGGWQWNPFLELDQKAMYRNLSVRPLNSSWMSRPEGFLLISVFCNEWANGRRALPYLSAKALRGIDTGIWFVDGNDDDLSFLQSIKSMRLLSIDSDCITDEGILKLLNSESVVEIEYLRVIGSRFTGRVASSFGRLKKLRALEFRPGTLTELPADWNQQVANRHFEFMIVKEKNSRVPDDLWDVIICN